MAISPVFKWYGDIAINAIFIISIFLLPASAMLILAMLAMSNIYGRVFIVFLIIFKYIYFFTRIETVKA